MQYRIPSVLGSKDLITPHVLSDTKSSPGAISVKFGTMKASSTKYDICFNVNNGTTQTSITEISLNFDVKGMYVQVDISNLDCAKIAKFTYVGPVTVCVLSNSTVTVGITMPCKQRNVRFGINQITVLSTDHDSMLRYFGECAASDITSVNSRIEHITFRQDVARIHTYFLDYAIYNLFQGRSLPSMEYYNGGVAKSDDVLDSLLLNACEHGKELVAKQEEVRKIEEMLARRNKVLSFAGQDKLRFLGELKDSLQKELELVASLINEYTVASESASELPTEIDLRTAHADVDRIKTQLSNHIRTTAYKLITRENNNGQGHFKY